MRQASIRGIGIRYVIAMMLPLTGAVLVLYTVAQLLGFQMWERRTVRADAHPAVAGSNVPLPEPLSSSAYPPPSPKK